jgi:hypothetical protein
MNNYILANSVNIKLQITTKQLWLQFKTPVSFTFRFKTLYNSQYKQSTDNQKVNRNYAECIGMFTRHRTDMSSNCNSLATELNTYFGRQPFVVLSYTNFALRTQRF